MTSSELLTKDQAAEYLQVSPQYIELMVREHCIRPLKPTFKVWRVRRSELDAFMAQSPASIAS